MMLRYRVRALLAVAVVLSASCNSPTNVAVTSPSPVAGALTGGLIAFVADQGVGVLDPATGKTTIVAPMPAGAAFRGGGPVVGPLAWAPLSSALFHDPRRPPGRAANDDRRGPVRLALPGRSVYWRHRGIGGIRPPGAGGADWAGGQRPLPCVDAWLLRGLRGRRA